MNDFENYIFNKIAVYLRSEYENIYVTGERNMIKAESTTFPAVSIVMMSTTVYEKGIDNAKYENFTNAMFEVDVYSNLTSDKKAQAKDIMSSVDKVFTETGFVRTFCEPVENLANSTIYRLKARYTAVVGTDGYVYTK